MSNCRSGLFPSSTANAIMLRVTTYKAVHFKPFVGYPYFTLDINTTVSTYNQLINYFYDPHSLHDTYLIPFISHDTSPK